jgi:hypothetical protein
LQQMTATFPKTSLSQMADWHQIAPLMT